MNRKGLSDVITTVLIILLVLAAVVLIWSFIQPAIKGGVQSAAGQTACFGLDVSPVSCKITGTNYVVKVKNNGASAIDTKAIIVLGDESTLPVDVAAVPAYGTKDSASTTLTAAQIASGTGIVKAKVAPIAPASGSNPAFPCPINEVTVVTCAI